MDNTLGFNVLIVGRINDLIVENLIKKLVDIWGKLISWL